MPTEKTKSETGALPAPIKNIPPKDVAKVVQSFITNDGVKQMDVNQQPNGKFTITPLK